MPPIRISHGSHLHLRIASAILLGFAAGCSGHPATSPSPTPPPSGATHAVSPAGAWFEEKATAAGVKFTLGHGGRSPLTLVELMGPGCAVADFDGDGKMDIFVVGQSDASPGERCKLYRNTGHESFEDVTASSGLDTPGRYMGCAVADIDNDGRPDLLVTGYGVVRLFKNLGGFKFADVTKGSGLEAPAPDSWATSAAFFDYDRDGKVDLYIGRYVVFNSKTIQLCNYDKVKAACGPLFYDPQQGSLYHNEGGFKFKDTTRSMGVYDAHGKCLGVAAADINGDGWPDLYLANDETPGDLYINDAGKGFRNVGVQAGAALAPDGSMQGGMGVDFGDYDRDGRTDLFVTTFEGEPDSLYRAAGAEMFEHSTISVGMDQPTRSLVGFGTKFVDTQNRGWLDLVITNGHIHDNQEQIGRMTTFKQPLQLFVNQLGKTFQDSSANAGPGFTTPAAGRALAIGDLNNDGLVDLVVTDAAGPVRVLYNRFPNPGNWISVRLAGSKSNRMGIGARVTVSSGTDKWQAECTTAGSYLCASDPRLHFGLGLAKKVDRVDVLWPSGSKSEIVNPALNTELLIEERK